MISFKQPDSRFAVWAAVLPAPRGPWFVFVAADERHAPHRAEWRVVDGVPVILIGEVDEALAGLIDNYTNAEWREMLGLHPGVLAPLRRHLGIAAEWAAGAHGGRRPGAGRKTTQKEEAER